MKMKEKAKRGIELGDGYMEENLGIGSRTKLVSPATGSQ